jgi:protein gp37
MSDLFLEAVIIAVTTIMLRANWHTYRVLTKRADRMEQLLRTKLREAAAASHIWWGVSV